jgi:RNA polymerase sigma-70 factor (ECF subfamily)
MAVMLTAVGRFGWGVRSGYERVDAVLERARGGDVAAFEAVIADLLLPAYRLALTMLRDADRAEDAVQDATLKAWAGLARLRDDNSLRSWFLTIVANECRSAMRIRPWLALDASWLHREPRPAHDVAAERIDVARAVAGLGQAERLAVYLYYYMDLEVPEAARIARVSEAAFRSRLARATRRLRPQFEQEAGSDE